MRAWLLVVALAGCSTQSARDARFGGMVVGVGGLGTGVVAGGFAVAGAEPYLYQSALLVGGIAFLVGASIFVPSHVRLTCFERYDAEDAAVAAAVRQSEARRGEAWALTQAAARAARSGDCDRVKELGAQVEAIDPETRRTVFVADVAIARCLGSRQP